VQRVLTAGNSKTGPGIYLWSLPCIDTCPGATKLCKKKCYARSFKRFGLEVRYGENLELANKPDFVPHIVQEINDCLARVVRIHCSGDFYSAAYVRKWIQIVQQCPSVAFYGYTKSWAIPKMYPALNALRMLPNMELWWSCDRECVDKGVPEGRIAYMSENDQDVPVKDSVDLVFRCKRNTVRKRMAGARVCPKENGDPPFGMTCQSCRLCFRDVLGVTQ
jgi:hypothetical protein